MEKTITKTVCLVGIIIAIIECCILIFLYISDMEPRNWVTLIMNNLVLIMALVSISHLSTRASAYDEKAPFRKYLKLMTLFFLPVIVFGIYLIIDEIFYIEGRPGVSDQLNNLHPSIIFLFAEQEKWKVTMPMASIFTFGILMFAIISFMYPIERFIRQEKRPIHTISQLLIICIMPLMFVDVLVENTWLITVLLFASVLIVLINFLYLFWVYFSVAMKSPAGPVRNGGLMIAFSLIMIILAWASTWILADLVDWLKFLITYSITLLSVVLLNLGFYTLRPITAT